jgi:hypothetical protein
MGQARQERELIAVVIHRVGAAQEHQLVNGTVCQRRPKSCVGELGEAVPRWLSTVELQMVEPQFGILQQMEGGISHPLVLRCASYAEISLTAIKPWQGITRAIKLGEFQFVHHRDEVIARIILVSITTVVRRTPRWLIVQSSLNALDSEVQSDLLLLLLSHARLHGEKLIDHRL